MNKKEFKVSEWLNRKPITTYPKSDEYSLLTIDNEIEPIVKIILLQVMDVCTTSQEAEDPWNDSNWND